MTSKAEEEGSGLEVEEVERGGQGEVFLEVGVESTWLEVEEVESGG